MFAPEPITAYRDGRFCMVDEPSWWRAFEPKPDEYEARFGQEHGNMVETMGIPEEIGHGWLVRLWTAGRGTEVWAPSTADYLELLTTRAGAFLALGEERPAGESLDHIRNALIAFIRHGDGKHIDRWDGHSSFDAQEDREMRRPAKETAGRS